MDETDMHAAGESLKQFIQRNYLKRVTVSWNAQRWEAKPGTLSEADTHTVGHATT